MLSFRQLLDYRVLTAAYEERPTQRDYALTQTFYDALTPTQVDGDEYKIIYYPAMNQPAPMNSRGSEARVLTPAGASEKDAVLFHAFNKIPLPMAGLEALREPDSETLQEKGRREIGRVFEQFKERHVIYKELVLAKILTGGVVYADANGVILESASGAVIAADFGVPATHKGNLDSIISALWSVASTKIGDQIDAIRDQAEEENAPPPTDIWLHPMAKRHLRNNTQFETWAKENSVNVDTVLRGDMIENLWGLNWHFYGAKYQAADGTMKDFIPQTGGILVPEIGPWLRAGVGSTLVPRTIDIVGSVDEALNNIDKVYGEFAYAKLEDDPLKLLMYMGDTFGLNFANPNAIWMPTLFS